MHGLGLRWRPIAESFDIVLEAMNVDVVASSFLLFVLARSQCMQRETLTLVASHILRGVPFMKERHRHVRGGLFLGRC
jgi:hypothetical protein